MKKIILTIFLIVLLSTGTYSALSFLVPDTNNPIGSGGETYEPSAIGGTHPVALTSDVSGILPEANGGTNSSEYTLSSLGDLTGNKTFTMNSSNLTWNFTTPSGGMTFAVSGAFSNHLLNLIQTIGNPGPGTQLLHLMAEDADVEGIIIETAGDSLFANNNVNFGANLSLGNNIATNTLSYADGGTLFSASSTVTTNFNVGGLTSLAGSLLVLGQASVSEFDLTDGATIAVDWNNGNGQRVIIGGDREITMANPKLGATYRINVCQDDTGSRLINTWPVDVLWSDDDPPTLTTAGGKCDAISFMYTNATSTPIYQGAVTPNF